MDEYDRVWGVTPRPEQDPGGQSPPPGAPPPILASIDKALAVACTECEAAPGEWCRPAEVKFLHGARFMSAGAI